MSYEQHGFKIGNRTATANYSSDSSRYTVVKSTANTTFSKQTTKGGFALGILQNTPSSGSMGEIVCFGITKARVTAATHTAIAIGDRIIASSGAGVRASTGTTVANYTLGRALETLAANTTGIIAVLLTHEGSGSTGTQNQP